MSTLFIGAFAPHLVRGDTSANVPLQIINLAAQGQHDGSVLYRVCVLSNPDTVRGNVTLTPTTAAAAADIVVTMAGLTCGLPNSYLLEGTQTFGPSAQVSVYQLQQICVVNSSSVSCLSRNQPLLGFGLTVYPDCSTDFTVDQSGAVIAPTVLTPCLNGQGSLSSTMPSPVTATPTATPTLAPPTCVPATATSTPSSTDTATAVASSTATPQPTSTEAAQPTSTSTALPSSTSTNTPLPAPTNTNTPQPTNTAAAPPTNTSTPLPTSTSTALPTSTATPQPTNTLIPFPTSTNTPLPVSTNTPTPTSTRTPTPEVTLTTIPLLTPTKTPTRTPTSAAQAHSSGLHGSALKAHDAGAATTLSGAGCSATSTSVPATAAPAGSVTGTSTATTPATTATATAAAATAAAATATAAGATAGATTIASSPAATTPTSGQLALTSPRRTAHPARPSLSVSLSAHLLRPGDVLLVRTHFVKGAVVHLVLGYAPHRTLALSGHADRKGALTLRLRIPAVSLPHGHGTASLGVVATAGKQQARFATRLALSNLIMGLSAARIRACAQVLTLRVAYVAHAAVQFTVSYLKRAHYRVTVTTGRNGRITRQLSVSYLALKPAGLTLTAVAAGRHGRQRDTESTQLHVSVPAACRST